MIQENLSDKIPILCFQYSVEAISVPKIGWRAQECLFALCGPIRQLCHNEGKTALEKRRSRQSGDEALGRRPFIGQLPGSKPLERLDLQEARLCIPLNDRLLKLRSLTVCSVRTSSPSRLRHNLRWERTACPSSRSGRPARRREI
jgi:hypothetical protein